MTQNFSPEHKEKKNCIRKNKYKREKEENPRVTSKKAWKRERKPVVTRKYKKTRNA